MSTVYAHVPSCLIMRVLNIAGLIVSYLRLYEVTFAGGMMSMMTDW